MSAVPDGTVGKKKKYTNSSETATVRNDGCKSNTSHDQNFKNLILDYPRQSLRFFAAEEAFDLADDVAITPVRQEQLKDRLGDRFHELDTPLQAEWPDGSRAAVLFVAEEETERGRFPSIAFADTACICRNRCGID